VWWPSEGREWGELLPRVYGERRAHQNESRLRASFARADAVSFGRDLAMNYKQMRGIGPAPTAYWVATRCVA
jgi:hypothetical protein